MKKFIYKILLVYVNWERMWYNPKKCNFKIGDKLRLNWKAKVSGYSIDKPLTFVSIDKDNVVETIEDGYWHLYWLK
jgi:hypothetical protein